MRTAVIVTDHIPLPGRVATLRQAHPHVHCVTPWDKPNAHSVPITPPPQWLPEAAMTYTRKCWYKADVMNLAAVCTLRLNADFYWFIESDVWATAERWQALFADWENDPTDCVSHSLKTRDNMPTNHWWNHKHTPEWVDAHFILACYRLSRRAVEECIAAAGEMRNVFSEVTIASLCRRAGLTMASVNTRQHHWNVQTFKTHEERVKFNPALVNHPVKNPIL